MLLCVSWLSHTSTDTTFLTKATTVIGDRQKIADKKVLPQPPSHCLLSYPCSWASVTRNTLFAVLCHINTISVIKWQQFTSPCFLDYF